MIFAPKQKEGERLEGGRERQAGRQEKEGGREGGREREPGSQ
jgi:hypothetical protein